ncbi:MAG: hypothetical protein ACI95C_002622 [Pseudohongiellaceae bacterium]|jgi:hypothetical protein
MTIKNYFITCAAVSALTVAVLLLVPSFADSLEQQLLVYFSTNAR